MNTDVLVVGSGAAGLAAAVEASTRGADVLLLEKNPYLGGTTGISVGSFSACGTSFQKREKIEDRPEDFNEDIGKFAEHYEARNNHDLRLFFAQHSGETMAWLQELGVEFYGPSAEPPNRVPRMHNVVPNSKAYIATMHRHLLRNGVRVLVNHRVEHLLRDPSGSVHGVVARAGKIGESVTVEAANGVILAAGDYSNSEEIKSKYVDGDTASVEGVNPTATGDGFRMAMEVGAAAVNMDVLLGPQIRFVAPPGQPFTQLLPVNRYLARIAAWGTRAMPRKLLERFVKSLLVTWQHPEDHLFEAGAILVNKQGDRFCNELDGPERAIPGQVDKIAYIVFDQALAKKFNEWPYYISTAPDIAYAYLNDYKRLRKDVYFEGETPGNLARRMGIPGARLESTVQGVMQMARGASRDPFGRPEFGSGFDQGLYYALGPTKSWIVISEGGLVVNTSLEVLDTEGKVIPGLYAAGSNGQGGLMLWGHGLHIAWAFTSGRMAGRNAAGGSPQCNA